MTTPIAAGLVDVTVVRMRCWWFGCEPHPKRLVGFTEHAEREFAKQTFAAGNVNCDYQ